MAATDELEPQQYENIYWEESVPVKDVRKNALRKFVYVGSLLCAIFIIIGLFVKFSDQVELPFVLKSQQSEDIYRFSFPLYVVEKYAKPGDDVKKGQPLVKISSPEIVTMINNYNEADQLLKNFQQQKLLSVEKQKEIISAGIRQNESRMVEIQNEINTLNNTWKSNSKRLEYEYNNAVKKYEDNKKLLNEKVISEYNFLEYEKSKIALTDSLFSARLNYKRDILKLSSISNGYVMENIKSNAELNKLIIDTKYTEISLNNQLTLAKDKIKNTFGNYGINEGNIILLANENGKVSYIFDGEKEVTTGSILLKIMYSPSPFYASVDCPASMIGKIKKGQIVALKVSSFPFYEWGTAKGNVDNVSLTPDEKGNFSIKINITDVGKLNNLLQIGMNGNASIVLEERTFYDYFFRKLKKTYHKMIMDD